MTTSWSARRSPNNWSFGKTARTCTPARPTPVCPGPRTATGTFPVYARFSSTTMEGTDPDGYHYDVTGVPWVAYFNGGRRRPRVLALRLWVPPEQRLCGAARRQRPGGMGHGPHRHARHRLRLDDPVAEQPAGRLAERPGFAIDLVKVAAPTHRATRRGPVGSRPARARRPKEKERAPL